MSLLCRDPGPVSTVFVIIGAALAYFSPRTRDNNDNDDNDDNDDGRTAKNDTDTDDKSFDVDTCVDADIDADPMVFIKVHLSAA